MPPVVTPCATWGPAGSAPEAGGGSTLAAGWGSTAAATSPAGTIGGTWPIPSAAPVGVTPASAEPCVSAGTIPPGAESAATGALAGRFEEAARADADVARYLSMLLVEVTGARVRVTPVFLDDVAALYAELPDGQEVRVDDPTVPVSRAAVARCLHEGFTL